MRWEVDDFAAFACIVSLTFVFVRRDLSRKSQRPPAIRALAWFHLLSSVLVYFLIRLQVSLTSAVPDAKAMLDGWMPVRDTASVGVYMVLNQQIDRLSKTTSAINYLVFVVFGLMLSVSVALRIAASPKHPVEPSTAAS